MDDPEYEPYRSRRRKRSSRAELPPEFSPRITRRQVSGLNDGGGGGDVYEDDEEDVALTDFDDDDDDDDDDDEDENDDLPVNKGYHPYVYRSNYSMYGDDVTNSELDPKRRKLDEFSNKLPGWSDFATLTLLEVWGDRFLQLGRKSLRSEDWTDISEKVSEWVRSNFTVMDCRHQLDALKKRYKKERAKIERTGSNSSSWMHFRKMDMLMMGGNGSSGSSNNGGRISEERCGLPCGVDSGEFCFADMDVYLEKSNAFDEMMDSPGEEEVEEDDLDDEQKMEPDLDLDDDDLPPRRRDDGGEGIRVLADSIERFGEVYEKMESSKRAQMMELRKLKADFMRELELQKNEIVDRANAEIAKIKAERGETDDTDGEYEDDYSSNDA